MHLTLDNPDIREEELDVSDEVPEIKSKLSFKEETEAEIQKMHSEFEEQARALEEETNKYIKELEKGP